LVGPDCVLEKLFTFTVDHCCVGWLVVGVLPRFWAAAPTLERLQRAVLPTVVVVDAHYVVVRAFDCVAGPAFRLRTFTIHLVEWAGQRYFTAAYVYVEKDVTFDYVVVGSRQLVGSVCYLVDLTHTDFTFTVPAFVLAALPH